MASEAAKGSTSYTRSSRAPWRWRALVSVATLAAVAVLAVVVAHWGWRWFAPRPPPSAPPIAAGSPAATLAANAPFGRPSPAAGAPATQPAGSTGVVLSGQTRLLGVIAGRDGDGHALFRLADRGPVLVRAGQDVAPEVKLQRVTPEGVELIDHGERREILLRAAPPMIAPAARSDAGTAKSACLLPPGYSGPAFRLNAELLEGMAGRADGWGAMLAPSAQGLVVDDATGIAALLGMKRGDRIAQANGIALATLGDVQAAVVRPLIAKERVRLSGTRDGKPHEWLLLNAGSC